MPRIYAKVSIKMWGDKKFVSLSPLRPSGQALWLYLLTGEFRTSIPGLSLRVGLGALADRLKWPLPEVERRWREIEFKQMGEADWRAGVIWLPRGIEHNEPESPNVIKGWGKLVLPECDLTEKALRELRRYIAAHLREGFVKAFDEVFREGLQQVSANQEQEQEEDTPLTPAHAGGRRPSTRSERKRADARLQSFRDAHPPISMAQFRELEAAGEPIPDTPKCMHVPCCDEHERCIRLLVDDERAAERRAS